MFWAMASLALNDIADGHDHNALHRTIRDQDSLTSIIPVLGLFRFLYGPSSAQSVVPRSRTRP